MGGLVPFVCPCDRCRLRALADNFSHAMGSITLCFSEATEALSAWGVAYKALPEAVRDRMRFPGTDELL